MSMNMDLLLRISGEQQGAKKAIAETVTDLQKLETQTKKVGEVTKNSLSEATPGLTLNRMQWQEIDAAIRHSMDSILAGQNPIQALSIEASKMSAVFTSGAGALSGWVGLIAPAAGLALMGIVKIGEAIYDQLNPTSRVLQSHADLIKKIGEEWDSATGKAKAYSVESALSLGNELRTQRFGIKKEYQNTLTTLSSPFMEAQGNTVLPKAVTGFDGMSLEQIKTAGGKQIADLVSGFIDQIKAGTPDVMKFRNELIRIGDAAVDPNVEQMAKKLFEASTGAATLQQALKENQDKFLDVNNAGTTFNKTLSQTSDQLSAASKDFGKFGLGASGLNGLWAGGMLKPLDDIKYPDRGSIKGFASAPVEYRVTIAQAANTFGLDADLLARLLNQESGFNPNARSKKGAGGLGQLMPDTARSLGVEDVFDPKQNIMGSASQLSKMMRMFGGNQELALAGYNWGEGNVQKWLKKGGDTDAMPKETRDYISNILTPESIVSGNKATDKSGDAEKKKAIEQEQRWARTIKDSADAEVARAQAIGKSVGEQAQLTKAEQLWAQARSTFGDRLEKDKKLHAEVSKEIEKQAAAYGLLAEQTEYAKKKKEALAKIEAQNIAQMDEVRTVGSEITRTFLQSIDTTHSWGEALSSTAGVVKNKLLDMLDGLINKIAFGEKGTADGGLLGGLGKGIGDFMTNLFNPSIYGQGAAFAGGAQAFASGGHFTNSIVSQPTYFKFGGKPGLMGEAGPEAIIPLKAGSRVAALTPKGETSLPLTRMADGSLGVAMPHAFAKGDAFGSTVPSGDFGSGGDVKINSTVHNYGGEKVTQTATRNSSGGVDLQTMIGAAVNKHIGTGGADSALTGRFSGLSQRIDRRG